MIIQYALEDRHKIITEYKAQGLALKSDKRLVSGNYLEFVKPEEIIVPKSKPNINLQMVELKSSLAALQAKTVKHDEDIASILSGKEK